MLWDPSLAWTFFENCDAHHEVGVQLPVSMCSWRRVFPDRVHAGPFAKLRSWIFGSCLCDIDIDSSQIIPWGGSQEEEVGLSSASRARVDHVRQVLLAGHRLRRYLLPRVEIIPAVASLKVSDKAYLLLKVSGRYIACVNNLGDIVPICRAASSQGEFKLFPSITTPRRLFITNKPLVSVTKTSGTQTTASSARPVENLTASIMYALMLIHWKCSLPKSQQKKVKRSSKQA